MSGRLSVVGLRHTTLLGLVTKRRVLDDVLHILGINATGRRKRITYCADAGERWQKILRHDNMRQRITSDIAPHSIAHTIGREERDSRIRDRTIFAIAEAQK